MKVDVAIPRTKFDFLTYETPIDVSAGDLVQVPLRNNLKYGIVVNKNSKRDVTGLKTIHALVQEKFIPLPVLRLYSWIAEYYLSSLGDVLRLALPAKVLKTYEPSKTIPPRIGESPSPTYEQSHAIEKITSVLRDEHFEVFLLHGITGSGKTEVYLRCVEDIIKKSGRALVLVPEISMTPLLFDRFQERFTDTVITIHSMLTEKERRNAWYAIRNGEYRVIIGPRSVIYIPIPDLKIIIVDEEHDQSYKEHERTPRYNARDVAVMRGNIEGIPVLLGSATPQVESYHNTEIGKYTLLSMDKRIDNKPLPTIEIVDLKKENKKFISHQLEKEIENTILNNEQVILFLNRRGFAPHLVCPNCGFVAKCPYCTLPLVYHKPEKNQRAALSCHICSHSITMVSICPQCGRSTLLYRGAGTQRIEDITNKILVKYGLCSTKDQASLVIRLDRDAVRKKGQAETIIKRFTQRKARILLGTQLVTKGFDFPEVTLVGIVNADIILNLPDFRSSERTFQLLTQVSGRAGRGDKPGRVFMQTYHPEQYAILFSQLQNYQQFYTNELNLRKEFGFPPFSKLVLLQFKSSDEKVLWQEAQDIATQLKNVRGLHVFGPNRSFYYKIRKHYRVFVLLKMSRKFRHQKLKFLYFHKTKNCQLTIDVDPLEIF